MTYPITAVKRAGLPAAPCAYAIAQAYGDLTESERSDALFGSVTRKLCTVRELRDALAAMPRVKARRELVARIEAVEAGAESWLEERALKDALTGRPFDSLIRQHRIVVEGQAFRLDMYDPFTRTAIEADSFRWHAGDQQRLRDIRRDALLATIGIQTIRLSSRDLIENADWCRAMVQLALTARR
ncbi:endonuclease domain-containing protein [Demequina sp. NBRC 110053]|uniref:endonuclease domain-containing protein n=1 Tax=Demequina sp. NBRC 110053 TaxID=1570342 RepID=UPI001185EFFF|nr:hypothetical protein [Demequina sp. NBRC 110053]